MQLVEPMMWARLPAQAQWPRPTEYEFETNGGQNPSPRATRVQLGVSPAGLRAIARVVRSYWSLCEADATPLQLHAALWSVWQVVNSEIECASQESGPGFEKRFGAPCRRCLVDIETRANELLASGEGTHRAWRHLLDPLIVLLDGLQTAAD